MKVVLNNSFFDGVRGTLEIILHITRLEYILKKFIKLQYLKI